MASFSSPLFLGLLVVICAFMAAPSSVEADQLQFLTTNGTVRTVIKITLVQDGTTPLNQSPFANAGVELRSRNTTLPISGSGDDTGNEVGKRLRMTFDEILDKIRLSLKNCNAVIETPVAECNATLPSSIREFQAEVEQVLFTTVNGVNITSPVISQSFRFRNIFG